MIITIYIKVITKTSYDKVIEDNTDLFDGKRTIKIKTTAAPIDGEANKKIIEILAKYFSRARSKIKITHGLSNCSKIVQIDD